MAARRGRWSLERELEALRTIRRGLRGGLPPSEVLRLMADGGGEELGSVAGALRRAATSLEEGHGLSHALSTALKRPLHAQTWIVLGEWSGDPLSAMALAEERLAARIRAREESWSQLRPLLLLAVVWTVLAAMLLAIWPLIARSWSSALEGAPPVGESLFYLLSPWLAFVGVCVMPLSLGLLALPALGDRPAREGGLAAALRRAVQRFDPLRRARIYEELSGLYAGLGFGLQRGMALGETLEVLVRGIRDPSLRLVFEDFLADLREGGAPQAILITPFVSSGARGLLHAQRMDLERSLRVLARYYGRRGDLIRRRRFTLYVFFGTLAAGVALAWFAFVTYFSVYYAPLSFLREAW